MNQEGRSGLRVGPRAHLLAIAAVAVAGCQGDPLPADFDASYYASIVAAREGADVVALYESEDGSDGLPKMDVAATVTVNGRRLPLVIRTAHGGFDFEETVPEVAPGASYDFVLELPSAPAATCSTIMVQPAELTAPAAATEIRLGQDDVHVEWSAASPGETDRVYLDIPGVFSGVSPRSPGSFFSTAAAAGETNLTVPASVLAEWVELAFGVAALPAPTSPVAANLVLSRSREGSTSPPFGGGEIALSAEISTVPVVIVP